MGNKTTSKKTKDEPEVPEKKKGQKVKILVSIWRFENKIVSWLGIPDAQANVEHRIPKSRLKEDEIFNIISSLSTDSYFNRNANWKETVNKALDRSCPEIPFPPNKASVFNHKPIGKLVHEILNIEIELFVKN